jgi:integrase
MARPPKGTWDSRRACYVAALGPSYRDARGRVRRRAVRLEYADGTPVAWGDRAGVLEALARLERSKGVERRRKYDPTTAELFRLWIEWHANRGGRETSDGNRRGYARRICNTPYLDGHLGDVSISEFGVEHLFHARKWLREKRGDDKGAEGYVRNQDSVILAAFRWASQAVEGRDPVVLLDRNPFPPGSVRQARASRSDRPCPTWEELRAILDATDAYAGRSQKGYGGAAKEAGRTKALWVRVIGERGCRPREVGELRVEQWDDDAGGFVLGRHKMSEKTGAIGVIPLSPATAERVRALVNLPGRRGPWVFGPHRTEAAGPPPLRRLWEWWRLARERVPGAKAYSLYSFRNCVSNKLRLAGIDGRAMQLAMRHGPGVADVTYRRDTLMEAARVFESAGL